MKLKNWFKIFALLIIFKLTTQVFQKIDYISVRPNNVKIENSSKLLDKTRKITAKYAMSRLSKIPRDNFQYIDTEFDGYLLDSNINSFVQAVHLAYSEHLPLVISPDIFWYLISSGVSSYVNKNSEELREKFVYHKEKKKISFRCDDFVWNSQTNPWHILLDKFLFALKDLIKNDISEILVANFSTTTRVTKAVSVIVLMDAMKKYFQYEVNTACGIPEIRIQGTKEDWLNIKNNFKLLINLIPRLQIWYDNGLEDIMNNFINVFDGKIDSHFWNQIYKQEDQSGGPYISGWILSLFPYENDQENIYVWEKHWETANLDLPGVTAESFAIETNKVPFIWNYDSVEFKMLFIGGFIGLTLDKNQAISPVLAYGIANNTNEDVGFL